MNKAILGATAVLLALMALPVAAQGLWQGVGQLQRPMTLMVLGVDRQTKSGGPDRYAMTRSDTCMLVRLNPDPKHVAIVSIPRDSRVSIPAHGMGKINSAHALGGPRLTAATISRSFGVPVDRYVVVDVQDFKHICQLIGPVQVTVEKRLKYTDRTGRFHVDLKPGKQMLSPGQVEGYVRFRHDLTADVGRIHRQQTFLKAALNKMSDPQFLMRLPQIVLVAYKGLRTNLSLPELAVLTGFAMGIRPEQVSASTLPGHAQMIRRASYWVLDGSVRKFLNDELLVYSSQPSRRDSGELPLALKLRRLNES